MKNICLHVVVRYAYSSNRLTLMKSKLT